MQVARIFLTRSLAQPSIESVPRSDSFGKGSTQMLARLPVDSFTVHRKRLATRARASASDIKILHISGPVSCANVQPDVEEELQCGHASAGHDGRPLAR